MKEVVDVGAVLPGKVEAGTFKEKLDSMDLSQYKDKTIQLKGCGPVWAYLMVAHRLNGIAKGIEYLPDGAPSVTVYE